MADRQQQTIPFINDQKSGLEELDGNSPVAMNIMVKGTTMRRRPGLGAYSGAVSSVVNPAGISAVYTTFGGTLYAVGGVSPNRYIYRVTPGGAANLSNIPGGDLRGTARPVIAETQPILAFAGGDRPTKLLLATNTPSPLADAPQGRFVVAMASRLLMDDPDIQGLVDFSETNLGGSEYAQFERWGTGTGTAGFFGADARPDPIQALAENTNEVFVFGLTTLQTFAPVGVPDVFNPVVTKEIGCAARYSVVKHDQEFAWLDHLRRFVVSDGRSVAPISDGIQQTLNDLGTVADCYGFRFMEGSVDALVWVFPTDGRTFAYQKGFGWAEWSQWDAVNSNWAPFPVTAHHIAPGAGANVVGTSSGKVLGLSNRNATDLGSPIYASVTTGFIDRGSDSRKQCTSVRFSLRRGQTSGDEPVAFLTWRDDLGPFGPPIELSIGAPGDTEPVIELRSLGVYRRRQWKLTFTGLDELELVSAKEEFKVLAN